MRKNKLFKLVLKILIVLFSYGYIYYKFKSSHIDFMILKDVNLKYLLIAVFLMPINWLLEAIKWQYLLKDIQQISLKKALQGVLVGITSGMATPNRIGEYVGRTIVLAKKNRVKGSLATMLGSLSQILITLIIGLLGWFILFNYIRFFENAYYRPLFFLGFLALMVLLILIYYNLQWIKRLAKWLTINQKYIDELRFLSKYRTSELSFIIFLSFFRYVVFVTQYVLLLNSFGLDIFLLKALSAIAIIYLIIVFIPHFSISELGVRGSVSILIFQNFTNEHHLVAAAVSFLWLLNLAGPTLIGSVILFQRSNKSKK